MSLRPDLRTVRLDFVKWGTVLYPLVPLTHDLWRVLSVSGMNRALSEGWVGTSAPETLPEGLQPLRL